MVVGSGTGGIARSSLSLDEANSLVAARLAQIVTKLSVRGLIIKGLPLQFHGLRHAHQSADVDLLVEPGGASQVVAMLGEDGWFERPSTSPGSRISLHSVTLCCVGWPNDIDLHHAFPGLLAGPERSFEVLWQHREQMTVAGHHCWIPDRASSMAIWGLHSLRSTHTQPRHANELAELTGSVLPALSEPQREELADRIVELGADEPLRAVPALAEILGDRHGAQAPGALHAWDAMVTQANEATPWLQLLRDARPSERPLMLFRAIWPSARDLRLTDEALVDTPLGRARSRMLRIWRVWRRESARRRAGR